MPLLGISSVPTSAQMSGQLANSSSLAPATLVKSLLEKSERLFCYIIPSSTLKLS
jgi:hypothetical protein